MIYFITTGKHIKIGYSADPVDRLHVLQTGNPLKLRLIVTMQGYFKTESGLHELFSHLRCKGEWFRYTDELKWYTHAIRDNPDELNIKTLYMISQAKRMIKKSKKLGKEHKITKEIKRCLGR